MKHIGFRQNGRWGCSPIHVFFCVVAVLGLVGCEDEKWKKAALVDEEVQQRTYAPKPERSEALHVSGETITCDDILAQSVDQDVSGGTFKDKLMEVAKTTTLEQFIEVTRPQMRQRLNNNISSIVLYKQAKRQLGDKVDETLEKVTDKELRRFIFEHGGNDAQADEALKKMGMNRTSFKEQKKRSILAQYSASLRLSKDRPITHGELVACYDQMKDDSFAVPASVQFRLIDIQPDKIDVTDPNENRVDKARTIAEGLVGKIKAGEDFAALAQEHSNGLRREVGGLWAPRDPNSFVRPYDGLAKKAMEMQAGEIAGPIETPGHFFILKLEQKQAKSYRPMQEVQSQVERKIMDDRYDVALRRLDAEIAAQIAMADTDAFLDRCLERIHKQARTPVGK